jgi:hypothetical protein
MTQIDNKPNNFSKITTAQIGKMNTSQFRRRLRTSDVIAAQVSAEVIPIFGVR